MCSPLGSATFLGLLLFLQNAAAQTVVNSTFIGKSPNYSDPNNWAPAEVPNNTASTHYNVTMPKSGVYVDIDATISNLTLGAGPAILSVVNRTFTIIGMTLSVRPTISIVATGTDPSTLNAGTFSPFSNGALTGTYNLESYGTGAATLQFRGAQVTTLRDAYLTLSGALSHLLDENGNDALRNLAQIDAASTLALSGSNVSILSPLRVDGALRLGRFSQAPTVFTASASLTNFDPSTRTLSGGSFVLQPFYPPPDAGPVELRFAGADIVHNGSSITLVNDTSRITDLNGLDGLRNLARNLPGASLTLHNRALVAPGSFTNDGNLALVVSSFTVLGPLTNFDRATRTLLNGSYQLYGRRVSREPTFRFTGADIVHNGAFLALGSEASIADETGSDALRSFTDNLGAGTFIVDLGQVFIAPGDFTNAGRVETVEFSGYYIPEDPPPTRGEFTLPAGAAYTQTAGTTINNGMFTAERVDILAGTLSGAGSIKGNLTISDATVFPGGVIEGGLTLSPGSRVVCTLEEYSVINRWSYITGEVALAGTLEIEIKAENFLSSSDVLTILRSGKPLIGNFSNAPEGIRITSVDGSGSFVVKYGRDTVTLTEFLANPPSTQLLNISTRGYVKPGDDAFGNRYIIGGFIITGTEPKTVIARGIGPSLMQHEVGTPMNDPSLALHVSGTEGAIVSNNDWRDTQQGEIEASGLAPENARESALKVTLAPGAYTVVMQEASGLPGNGLIEVYDLSPNANSKLGNISTRGFIEPGGVLIGGIIAAGAGQANAEIVVRAIGPQLRRNGIFTALDDPTLELRDPNGGLVAFNDDWFANYEQIPDGFRPYHNSESAMRLSLPRGNYTAIVRAKGNGGGVALVEFYDLRR